MEVFGLEAEESFEDAGAVETGAINFENLDPGAYFETDSVVGMEVMVFETGWN